MTTLTCDRCGYIASKMWNLKKHLKRKNPCEPILSNDSVEDILE